MSDKQLICEECGETYSYEDHKTVYDCLNAGCDGSLVPDGDNKAQDEETGESGFSVSYKIPVAESPDGGLPVVNQNGELVGEVTDVDENEDGSFVADMSINSDSAEWMTVSEGCDGGNSINFPSHELTAGGGIHQTEPPKMDLLQRIKTATMCCGERMTPDEIQADDEMPGLPPDTISSARWRVTVSFICDKCFARCEFSTLDEEMGEKISEFWREHADNL